MLNISEHLQDKNAEFLLLISCNVEGLYLYPLNGLCIELPILYQFGFTWIAHMLLKFNVSLIRPYLVCSLYLYQMLVIHIFFSPVKYG